MPEDVRLDERVECKNHRRLCIFNRIMADASLNETVQIQGTKIFQLWLLHAGKLAAVKDGGVYDIQMDDPKCFQVLLQRVPHKDRCSHKNLP